MEFYPGLAELAESTSRRRHVERSRQHRGIVDSAVQIAAVDDLA